MALRVLVVDDETAIRNAIRMTLEYEEYLKEQKVMTQDIMVSGHGDISTAVECTKRGAFDFLEKPLNREKLLVSVRNAVRTQKLEAEVGELREKTEKVYQLVGDAVPM